MTFQAATDTEPAAWIITATVTDDDGNDRIFKGQVSENSTSANSVWLKEDGTTPLNDQPGQYIELKHPGYAAINDACKDLATGDLTKTDVGTILPQPIPMTWGLRARTLP